MGFWDDITGVTAAETAAEAQTAATQQAIDFQKEMYGQQQALLDPYLQAGTGALKQQQALAGTLGPQAQQAAIAGIQSGPGFQAALQQGETSLLQNAAATGGVRGGNIQGALAQFSPQLLGQAIDRRYGQLGGLTGLGQATAMGQAAAAGGLGQNVGAGLGQLGNIQAQEALGSYNLQKGFVGDIFGGLMQLGGLGVEAAGAGLF